MLKYIISSAVIILLAGNCNAQLKELLKQKAGEGVKQGAQISTEKAADKAVNKLFSKKSRKNQSDGTTADTIENPDKES